jgi:hypothetical protein
MDNIRIDGPRVCRKGSDPALLKTSNKRVWAI